MVKKTKMFGLIVIAFAMVGGCSFLSSCKTQVEITEDSDGEWRIYDEDGDNRGTLMIKPRHKVKWEVTGSDMVFFFPRGLNEYFNYDSNLFEDTDSLYSGVDGPRELRRIQRIDQGESLVLKVRRDAPADTIDYDIYVLDANKYVIGNSPPYLIIQRSYGR